MKSKQDTPKKILIHALNVKSGRQLDLMQIKIQDNEISTFGILKKTGKLTPLEIKLKKKVFIDFIQKTYFKQNKIVTSYQIDIDFIKNTLNISIDYIQDGKIHTTQIIT